MTDIAYCFFSLFLLLILIVPFSSSIYFGIIIASLITKSLHALLSNYNEIIPKQVGNDSAPIPSTNETSGRLAAPFCP